MPLRPATALTAPFAPAGEAVVQLGVDGALVAVSPEAHALAARVEGLRLDRPGFAFGGPSATRRLRQAVAEVRSGVRGVARLRLEPRAGAALLALVGVPGGLAQAPELEPGAAVVVVLREIGARPAVDRMALAAAFDLTPREAEVAARLAAGSTPSRIAAELQLSVGTVRNHLKRLFHKAGAGTQAQFVSLSLGVAGLAPCPSMFTLPAVASQPALETGASDQP